MEQLSISVENNVIYLSGSMTKHATVMNLDSEQFQNQSIVEIKNIIDISNKTNDLEQIRIDIKNITKIDTVGLATFLSWLRCATKVNVMLLFCNINDKISYACKLYGISQVLPLSDS